MQIFILCAVLLALLGEVINAQDSMEQRTKTVEAKDFFLEISEKLNPHERGAFETSEEYEARLPIPDTSLIYYFRIASSTDLIKSYAYDHDAGKLCIGAGDSWLMFKSAYDLPSVQYPCGGTRGELIELDSDTKELGEYQSSNAFGTSVSVKINEINVRILDIVNWKEIPKKSRNWKAPNEIVFPLCVCVEMGREEAELLAEDFEVLLGVKLIKTSRYKDCVDQSEPSFSHPELSTWNQHWVSVEFVELLLARKSSAEIVTKVPLNSKKKRG